MTKRQIIVALEKEQRSQVFQDIEEVLVRHGEEIPKETEFEAYLNSIIEASENQPTYSIEEVKQYLFEKYNNKRPS